MKKLTIIFTILTAFIFIIGSLYLYNKPISDIAINNQTEQVSQAGNNDPENNENGIEHGRLTSFEFLESYSHDDITSSNIAAYPIQSRLNPLYAIKRYSMQFTSIDTQGNEITITSQVFIPDGDPNSQLPIYVFGQGTTGLGDHCAPSQENPSVSNWGNYRAHMLAYASQGYIVVFPDYAGFNDPDRIHHYFNAELESNVLLDSTRAILTYMKQEESMQPSDDIFYAGYSQGGHAAFSVKDRVKEYAPEIPIKGVIGYGATTDMIALLKENPTLAPYVFYAYRDLYGSDIVNPSDYLQHSHLQTFDQDAVSICIGDIYEKYGYDAQSIYSSEFYTALFEDRLNQEYPDFYEVLVQNNTGLGSNSIPALILQGATDPIITVDSQKMFMRQVCSEEDTRLTYIEYPGVHHYQTRQVGIRDSLDWMKKIINGEIPESSCESI